MTSFPQCGQLCDRMITSASLPKSSFTSIAAFSKPSGTIMRFLPDASCSSRLMPAAVVVGMRMADNDCRDAGITEFLFKQFKTGFCSFNTCCTAKDYPAIFTAHKCQVRYVITSYLIYTVNYFKQAVQSIKLCIAPKI